MKRVIGRIGIALGIVALATGCGDQSSPLAPKASVSGPAATMSLSSTTNLPILRRLSALDRDYSTTANVGILGATLIIPQAGVTVVIPPLALSRTTQITITARAGSLVYYDFLPHGTTFALPVTVTQVLSTTNANGNLSLLSTLTGGYLPNGLADVSSTGVGSFAELFSTKVVGLSVGPAAIFQTKHFSGYAVASGRASSDDGDDSVVR